MKTIIKNLELLVQNQIPEIDKVEFRETTHKYSNDRKGTHISLNISFDKGEKLTWVNIGFQWDINYQFTVIFSRYVSDDWYRSVQFGSSFYDLEYKDQEKRTKYFISNLPKLVQVLANDKNIALKKELLQKKNEIEKTLLSL